VRATYGSLNKQAVGLTGRAIYGAFIAHGSHLLLFKITEPRLREKGDSDMSKFELKPEESVLVLIDFQERLIPAVDQRDKVIKNANLLIQLADKLNVPVIITEQYPQGLGRTVPEINENLAGCKLVEKVKFSAMVPELQEVLGALGRKKIAIAGTETHICVFQTVRDLVEAGFTVHVVQDAVGSRFEENYQSGLELMRDLGAVITNTETVIFDMLKVAGTPVFREMSKLLK